MFGLLRCGGSEGGGHYHACHRAFRLSVRCRGTLKRGQETWTDIGHWTLPPSTTSGNLRTTSGSLHFKTHYFQNSVPDFGPWTLDFGLWTLAARATRSKNCSQPLPKACIPFPDAKGSYEPDDPIPAVRIGGAEHRNRCPGQLSSARCHHRRRERHPHRAVGKHVGRAHPAERRAHRVGPSAIGIDG